ncbi:MAG: DUF1013 domain-containing protein [Alphaproteobacteria bacterium]|nr:DUF1013 domain-containing protein [Rickettsiales bacterium]
MKEKRQKKENENKKSTIAIPGAVANWLISETALTFDQIADFCGIHVAIIHNINGKDSKMSVMPKSPIGIYLSEEEIKRCESDRNATLKKIITPAEEMKIIKPKEKKYVSKARKRNRLDAAMWMGLFYPNISTSTIAKLVKSTSKTVDKIRKGIFKGIEKLVPKNPVILGLCSKEDLEKAIKS